MLGSRISLSILALLDRLPTAGFRWAMLVLLAVVSLASDLGRADAQALAGSDPTIAVDTTAPQSHLTYTPPTQATEFSNYFFDTFGPYPIAVAAATAGIDQFDNSPPEWKGGFEGYGKRFGSDLGIDAVSTTTRYALSEAFRQDPLYYRCECRGLFPRVGHAVISTFTARTGDDGHRVFSLPALVGPYAGSFVAVYAWYPNRYGAEDAFRIGNYSLLEYVGSNIVSELFYASPRSWLSRMHLRSRHGAPDPGSSR
jgi:hypothetical protein